MPTPWTERAKSKMHERGLSQEDLAASLSCTRGAVGHYLTGRRTPSLDLLERLATVLHVDPAWLLFGDKAGVGEQGADYAWGVHSIPLLGDIDRGLRRRQAGHVPLPGSAGQCYAIRINCNDYEPRIHAGETVIVNPEEIPAAGDEVMVRYRDGRLALHSLLRTDAGSITIDTIVGEKQVRTLTKKDYKAIHKVIVIMTVRCEACDSAI